MTSFPTKVLVGVDRSDGASRALDVGAAVAAATSSELHLVHVKVLSGLVGGRPVSPASQESMVEEGEALLGELRRRVEETGQAVAGTHVRGGTSIDEALARTQEELGAGLLVVGASRTGSIARRLVGSTSTDTARKAMGSVLVVRP